MPRSLHCQIRDRSFNWVVAGNTQVLSNHMIFYCFSLNIDIATDKIAHSDVPISSITLREVCVCNRYAQRQFRTLLNGHKIRPSFCFCIVFSTQRHWGYVFSPCMRMRIGATSMRVLSTNCVSLSRWIVESIVKIRIQFVHYQFKYLNISSNIWVQICAIKN